MGNSNAKRSPSKPLSRQSTLMGSAMMKKGSSEGGAGASYNAQELTLLDRMFQDLASRSPDQTMSKETFLEYFNLPGILGERLFAVFDTKKNGVIDFDEFVQGLARYNRGTMESKIDMLFDLYDLDQTAEVTRDELSTVLFSLVTPTTSLFYDDDTSAGLVQSEDEAKLDHVSQVTRQTVNKLVEDAFTQCAPDGAQTLSRAQFHAWVSRNPATIQVLETVLAKHIWSGFGDSADVEDEIKESQGSTMTLSNQPSLRAQLSVLGGHMSPVHGQGLGSPRLSFHQGANQAPTQFGQLARELPPGMVPVYRKLNELYWEESNTEHYQVFVCGSCKLRFCSSVREKEDPPPGFTDICVFKQTGPAELTIRFCPKCGGKVNAHSHSRQPSAANLSEALIAKPRPTVLKKGYLYKVGRQTKSWVARYHVIKDKFMYTFKKAEDNVPSHILFIQGYFFRAIKDFNEAKGYYGIEVMAPQHLRGEVSKRYCKSPEERDAWVSALQQAASTVPFEADFTIGRELGKGHFSVVHLGTHKKTGKDYAIKIVEKRRIDAREKLSLRNEIAIMKLVKHPCIINMVDVYEDKRIIYMVMTLIKCGDLFKRWQEKPNSVFEESVARVILWKLLDAVQYLHSLGIVHRDLKPENILCLDEKDDTKIVISDFGLSKFAAPHAEMTMPCGTLAYVAPEVLRQEKYGKKVDLWSLGCIMHLLLRGILPFDGKTKQDVIERTLNKPLRLDHAKFKTVSAEAKDLLAKLLVKDPEGRIDLAGAQAHKWFDPLRAGDTLQPKPMHRIQSMGTILRSNGPGQETPQVIAPASPADTPEKEALRVADPQTSDALPPSPNTLPQALRHQDGHSNADVLSMSDEEQDT